jgi:hypothetical protein
MKKTAQPGTYLARASRLLQACRDAGVAVKANILLHPGETLSTITETAEWLDRHRAAIKGLSVGPTIVFRYGARTHEYVASLAALGARPVDPSSLDREGFCHLHLSDELPHTAALREGLALSRRFMTARDYFALKSFSYMARGTTWPQFVDWCAAADPALLSFAPPTRDGDERSAA